MSESKQPVVQDTVIGLAMEKFVLLIYFGLLGAVAVGLGIIILGGNFLEVFQGILSVAGI